MAVKRGRSAIARFRLPILIFLELLAFAWTAVTSVADLAVIGFNPEANTWFPLVGYFVFATLVGLHIYTLEKRFADQRLTIIYEEGFPFEQWGPETYHGYRVGIKTKGVKSIRDVHVEIIEIDPPENAFIPSVVLRLKGNEPPQEEKYRFDLDPGETEYVDVVSNFGERGTHRFWLSFADRSKPNEMPAQLYPYRITLAAYGKDVVEPCKASFVIGVDNEGKLWFEKAQDYEKQPESRILPQIKEPPSD